MMHRYFQGRKRYVYALLSESTSGSEMLIVGRVTANRNEVEIWFNACLDSRTTV